jgi:hypothetical protein
MEMPRFTAAPWTASLTTGRHLVGGALHVGVVSAVALEARVHTCIPRFCGISSNAPHLSKRPTCFTGRECCDWQVCVWPWHRGTTATARLRENGCPRLGKRACSEQAEQRWCRGHTVVVHVDALGQQRRRKHEAWPHHGAVLRTAWARRPQRARAGPSARSLGGIVFVAACGGCCGGTRHGGMCSACSTHDAVAAVLPECLRAPVAGPGVVALGHAFRRVSHWASRCSD